MGLPVTQKALNRRVSMIARQEANLLKPLQCSGPDIIPSRGPRDELFTLDYPILLNLLITIRSLSLAMRRSSPEGMKMSSVHSMMREMRQFGGGVHSLIKSSVMMSGLHTRDTRTHTLGSEKYPLERKFCGEKNGLGNIKTFPLRKQMKSCVV